MSYVHMNFPGSPRKSYAPHTLFLGFSALLQNDENKLNYIALTWQIIPHDRGNPLEITQTGADVVQILNQIQPLTL